MEKSILYIGPSWAERSYDTPNGTEDNFTSLAKELNLPVTNWAKRGSSNIKLLDRIKNSDTKFDAIIWVFAEPLLSIKDEKWSDAMVAELVNSANWWSLRQELLNNILDKISALEVPIALIGAHSDVGIKDYKNITVIHPSWQKFLAEHAGVELEHGWGAEVGHLMMLKNDITPSKEFVELTSNTFKAWKEMELKGVFNWCHPTKTGNQLFAQEIKNSLTTWINNI
jgi:hypothetical protein